MRLLGLLLAVCLTLPAWAAPACQALISTSGTVQFTCRGLVLGTLSPGLFESGWRPASDVTRASDAVPADGSRTGLLKAPGGARVTCLLRSEAVADGLQVQYQLTPQQDVRLNSLHVCLNLAAARAIGGQYLADGAAAQFPAVLKNIGLIAKPMKTLELALPGGTDLTFAFTEATPVLVQDDRQWSKDFSIRIGPQDGAAAVWPAGKTLTLAFTLTAKGGMAVEYDAPVTIEAGPDWLPLDDALDIEPGSALDFSTLVPWHTPAGKYGRVIATPTGTLALAAKPTEPVRFYGCNLCFTGQYLPHDQADRLATRLQRLGYNAVRLHHYESGLIDRAAGNSITFNPTALDQFDYLFAALKQRGIYVTTDLFVSRPVFNKEIWEGVPGDIAMDDYKMAVLVNDRAYANYLDFARNLLTHVNPYTQMRYADDPALAWLSLINEGNAGNFIGQVHGTLREDWTRAWNRWLAARYPTPAALVVAVGMPAEGRDAASGTVPLPARLDNTPAGIQLAIFLTETERDFTRRMRECLHTLGCTALITNMNAWSNPVQNQAARQCYDYVDDHFYVDHPQFLDHPWALPSKCPNTSPVAAGAPGGRANAFVRLLDKPFTVSEFNYAGPGRFRGVGGILTSALGAVQNWSVIWRFAYSHTRESVVAPHPVHYFDLASDPLNQAADRAGVFLFRRGDLRPAPHALAITLTPDELLAHPRTTHPIAPDWNGLALVTRVGTQVVENPAQPVRADLLLPLTPQAGTVDPYSPMAGRAILAEMRKRGWLTANNVTDPDVERFQSETGELTVDGPADTLTLDTLRTAGGYARAGQRIETQAATITIADADATVWVSSLEDASIAASRRLLITHLTDLQNSGAQYGERARQTLYAWGKLPHLVHAGRAEVTLRLLHPERAHVWGLAVNGRRLAPIATRVSDHALVIPLDVNADGKARMLYEVVVE